MNTKVVSWPHDCVDAASPAPPPGQLHSSVMLLCDSLQRYHSGVSYQKEKVCIHFFISSYNGSHIELGHGNTENSV